MIALLLVLAQAAPVPAPTPVPPCDPQLTTCYSFQAYILGLEVYTPGQEKKKLIGARTQGEVRRKALRVQARLDRIGTPGTFQEDKFETITAIEGHVAVAWDAFHLEPKVTAGPFAAIGGAVALDTNKQDVRASIPRAVTAVLGARVGWDGGFAEGGCGSVQEFRRGIGCKVTGQYRAYQGEHTEGVGLFTISYGREWVPPVPALVSMDGPVLKEAVPGFSRGNWFAWVGFGLRVK